MAFVANDVIKSIVASTMTPDLKQLGYRKNAFTWQKTVDDVVKVVNVQLSRYNQSHESQFTINLGIYHGRFHQERGMPMPEKGVREYNCDVRVRIGELMGKTDYWWVVAYNKENDKVRDGVRHNVTHHALPWIEGFAGLPRMYDWSAEKQPSLRCLLSLRICSARTMSSNCSETPLRMLTPPLRRASGAGQNSTAWTYDNRLHTELRAARGFLDERPINPPFLTQS